MKHLTIIALFSVALFATSCKHSKNAQTSNEETSASETAKFSWIDDYVAKAQKNELEQNPTEIKEYTFNGETVYLSIMPCCDRLNIIHSVTGEELCKTGGITGKGDNKCPEFYKEAKLIKTIWNAESGKD